MDGLIQLKPTSFLQNSLSAYIAFSIGFLLRLLLYRIVLTELGAELFGTWAILKSILILPAFIQQALHTAIFIRVARNADNAHRVGEFLAVTLAVSLPIGTAVFLFAPGLASFFHLTGQYYETALDGFRVCAVLFVLDSFSQLFLRILQGLNRYRDAGILTTVAQFFNSAIAILLVYSGYQIVSLLFLDVTISGFLCLASIARLKFLIRPMSFSFLCRKQKVRDLVKETGSQFLTVLSGRILWELDPWLIPHFFGISAMASYYVARRIPYTCSDMLWAGAEPVVPAAAKAGEERKQALDRIHLLQVSIAVPIGFFLWVFAPDILNIWISDVSADTTFMMKMLVLARGIDFLPTTFLYIYFAEGKALRIMWITLVAALTKIVGSWLAILFGSLEFLIVMTIVGAIVYAAVLFADAQRQTGRNIIQMLVPFLPGLAASGISWVVVMMIPAENFAFRALLFAGISGVLTILQIRLFCKTN